MTTSGDQMLETRLSNIGGKGLFVKELEKALLDGKADLAVHSMKDVPAEQPEGLEIAVICHREDPRDVFISEQYEHIADMPPGAKIGTASLRRQSQLYGSYPHLDIEVLRGNVNTRLKRLQDGDFDAIVLAAAGLKRLGLESHIKHYFSTDQILPSAGQGALGIECRSNDIELKQILRVLADPVTTACLEAERAMTRKLGGNCRAPVAAYCEWMDGLYFLRGFVGSPKGDELLFCQEKGENPALLGLQVAENLLNQGAEEILKPYV